MAAKVAIVTGANKGIGLAIVRALCKQFEGDVYLTSRDVTRGEAAVKMLEAEGLKPKFHQLDIEDATSVEKLRDHVTSQHGGIDVLINNAGFAFKRDDVTEFGVQAEVTMRVNYFGTLRASKILLPAVKPGGRVVNVSSAMGARALAECSEANRKIFRDPAISEERLTRKMNEFVGFAKTGVHEEEGFADSAYGMSKVGVTVMSRVHARQLREQGRNDILLNSCCPGWVRTDMAGPNAPKSPDQGAETPVYLSLLKPGAREPHGEFLSDKTVQLW